MAVLLRQRIMGGQGLRTATLALLGALSLGRQAWASSDSIALQAGSIDPVNGVLVPAGLERFPTTIRSTGTGSTATYRLVERTSAAAR